MEEGQAADHLHPGNLAAKQVRLELLKVTAGLERELAKLNRRAAHGRGGHDEEHARDAEGLNALSWRPS
jgi:hypothetical protein